MARCRLLILEELYLKTIAKKTLSSEIEDSNEIAADLDEIAKFFSEVFSRRRGVKVKDITDKRLLEILKAYRGPKFSRVRINVNPPRVSQLK